MTGSRSTRLTVVRPSVCDSIALPRRHACAAIMRVALLLQAAYRGYKNLTDKLAARRPRQSLPRVVCI